MSDDTHEHHSHGGHGPNGDIHLPPNSWVPINVALSLMLFFVGFMTPDPIRWPMVVVGALWLVASLVQWARAGRNEFLDLPE